MCPTRELVIQNLMVLERMGKFSSITATSTAAADYGMSRRARIEDQVGDYCCSGVSGPSAVGLGLRGARVHKFMAGPMAVHAFSRLT